MKVSFNIPTSFYTFKNTLTEGMPEFPTLVSAKEDLSWGEDRPNQIVVPADGGIKIYETSHWASILVHIDERKVEFQTFWSGFTYKFTPTKDGGTMCTYQGSYMGLLAQDLLPEFEVCPKMLGQGKVRTSLGNFPDFGAYVERRDTMPPSRIWRHPRYVSWNKEQITDIPPRRVVGMFCSSTQTPFATLKV